MCQRLFLLFACMAEITVTLDFSIKFSATFNDSLLDTTSSYYNHLAATYMTQLTQAFSSTIGFQSITINRFWPGSIGVDYTSHYNFSAVTNATELNKQLTTNVNQNLHDLPNVDRHYLNLTLQTDIGRAVSTLKQVAANPCAAQPCKTYPFHNCSVAQGSVTHYRCISPCRGHDCGPYGGTCFLDSQGTPKCRCPTDDQYVYGGERCDQRAEKLDLSSGTIIAIASGLGGGLVFVLIVVVIVTCFRRHRRRDGQKIRSEDSESFRSITGMNRVAGSADGLQHGTDGRFYRSQPGDIASFLQREPGSPTDAAELARLRSEFYQRDWAPRQRGEDVQTPGIYTSATPMYLSPMGPYETSPPFLRHSDVKRDGMTSPNVRERDAESGTNRGYHKSPEEIYLNMSQEQIAIQRPQVSPEPTTLF